MNLPVEVVAPCACPPTGPVALTRTPSGWVVVSALGAEHAGDLVEGLTLADLVSEDLGHSVDPGRSARRSARGPVVEAGAAADPRDARILALERTVAQLEHALAARVSIERAIGVLAERNAVAPRTAFDALRGTARSQGRPVAELAREVLDSLPDEDERVAPPAPAARITAAPPSPRPVGRHLDVEDTVAGGRR